MAFVSSILMGASQIFRVVFGFQGYMYHSNLKTIGCERPQETCDTLSDDEDLDREICKLYEVCKLFDK